MTTTPKPETDGATERPWKRIRKNAAIALECLKSMRTVADARRYIQSVLDGIDTANALGELDQGGALTEAQIKHMVDRFLGWRLPEDFKPDAGISFERYDERFSSHRPKNEPTGTNLFDASQATAMVRYMVESIEAVNTHDTLQSENARLREQVKELREALRPFAETADLVPPGWEDDHSLGEWALCLDVADLRRARDLMEKTNA